MKAPTARFAKYARSWRRTPKNISIRTNTAIRRIGRPTTAPPPPRFGSRPQAASRILSRGSARAARLSGRHGGRSEEHTSELQSLAYLVCRLLLEKKKRCTRYLSRTPPLIL